MYRTVEVSIQNKCRYHIAVVPLCGIADSARFSIRNQSYCKEREAQEGHCHHDGNDGRARVLR